MNKTIENIWKEGFTKNDMLIPKIFNYYNKKSINLVEKIIYGFKMKVALLIPLGVCFFLFNIWLANDNSVFWGIISASPCIIWFYLGKRQIKMISEIDYKASSYEYLVSIKKKIEEIRKFNKRLAVSSVPITLLPMLIYTYFNQQGKSIGEIFGVDGLDYPTATIFLIIPIFTLIALVLVEAYFKSKFTNKSKNIDDLINEMEELRE